jgi:serine-type D-Ala-D-Ala carboxypeptidase (penicillin-binding protein 5/6)
MKRIFLFCKQAVQQVPMVVWTVLVVMIAFGVGFGLVTGAVYISEHSSELAIHFGADVQVIGQGGPELDETLQEDTGTSTQKHYVVRGSSTFPDISAKAFLIGDIETGQIIASRKKDAQMSIASISKLMTALVADETLQLKDETVISKTAVNTYGQQGGMRIGATYTIEELFYPLLLSSSNDAAEAIAEHKNRYTFLLDMNAKAKELELTQTTFEDASGLSPNNKSSAKDLFTLTSYLNKYRRYILDISMEKSHKERGVTWYSNSPFRNYKNYHGGKNGYTDEAGKTNIAIFKLPLEGEDAFREIAIIVLRSRDTVADTRAITTYLNKYVYYE